MSDDKPHEDWIGVGQFPDPLSAAVVSQRLTTEGIPNRIVGGPWFRRDPTCWIWVPPDWACEAKAHLAQDAVPEDELTALALKDSPPDDFAIPKNELRPAESHAQGPIVRTSGTPGWLIALLATGLLGALFLYLPRTQSHEVARQRSPDGVADAVLMEVSRDGAEGRAYKVCIQRAEPRARALLSCPEVAYLGGVTADGASQPVTLVWPSSSQLEIRYTSATSAHVYLPVFTWGSMRSRPRLARPAILVKAVQTGPRDGKLPAESE
jgi:hypothetical protein